MEQIAKRIRQANRVAIFTHMRPDGDAIGSALALSAALDFLKTPNQVCVETEIPSNLTFVEGVEKIVKKPRGEYDLLIVVDCSDEQRLGALSEEYFIAKRKKIDVLNIDHHVSNTRFGKYDFVQNCSANCMHIATLIEYLGVPFDKKIAEYLLLGLLTDSGNFSHDDVTEETLLLGAKLVKAGADICRYNYMLFKRQPKERAALYAKTMSGIRYYHDGRFAVIAVTKKNMEECGADQGMTSLRLLQNLKKELLRLHSAFSEKAEEFDHVIKMGRTQMQDAVPIRLGQEFKAYSVAVMRDIRRMDIAMDEMRSLNMGGTAIGTGINADEAYLKRIVPNLSEVSGMDFIQAFDLIDSTQNLDPFVSVSGAIKACAVTLSKIANDLRLMSSGPRAGFHEINLPAKQNGSSIMPGKVNPVIPEVVNQVAFNIIGNDMTITMAAEAGQLELNAFEPIIFYCLFQSIDTLAYAVETFVDNCVIGITANEERCRYLVENSVGIITAICPHVGYQEAADIAKRAMKSGDSVRELILKEKLLTEEELDQILNPVQMTEPGISGKDLLKKD